jgi:hypothetical protein
MNWLHTITLIVMLQATAPELAIVLPIRFAVPVKLEGNLSPSTVGVGTSVKLRVAYDLRWHECLVFRAGAPVIAIVTHARDSRVVGSPSLVELEIQSTVAADGTSIPLSGSIRAEGEDREMESIGAAAGVCCLGIFIPGGRQSIGKGVGTVATTIAEVEIQCLDE